MNKVPENSRLEIKFVSYEVHAPSVERWLALHPAHFNSVYEDRWVNNIYFDTYNYFAFNENLSGASARNKVRYRWYGQHDYPQAGVLEIKCKRNYFGWKYRFKVGESPHRTGDLWKQVHRDLRRQVTHEGKSWLDANPQPVILNRYRRQYFVSRDQKVRATIDTCQQVYDQRYKPLPNIDRKANIPQNLVLEFKFAREDRNIASAIIQGLPLRVSRSSKYMTAVKAIQGF